VWPFGDFLHPPPSLLCLHLAFQKLTCRQGLGLGAANHSETCPQILRNLENKHKNVKLVNMKNSMKAQSCLVRGWNKGMGAGSIRKVFDQLVVNTTAFGPARKVFEKGSRRRNYCL
jgi:hypothetical protein